MTQGVQISGAEPLGDQGFTELLVAVHQQSPTGLLIFDTDLRYVLVNPQMAAMANTPEEELLGRCVRDVFPDYSPLTERIEQVLATGEPLVGFDVTGGVPGEEGIEHTWSLSAYRLTARDGAVIGIAVASTEVTAARAVERERSALARRLELLAAAGDLLSGSLDEATTIEKVLDLVVPAIGVWAALHLLDPSDGTIRLAATRHAEATEQPRLDSVLGGFQVTTSQPYGAGHVIVTGQPEDFPAVTDDLLLAVADDDQATLSGFRSLGVTHGVVVPLSARGTTFGALSLSLPPDPAEDAADSPVQVADALLAREQLVADVAARAALALDSARLYTQQHTVAVTLQRSLLPRQLPQVPQLELAAAYLPGATGTEVGGDFYEALVRDDGRMVLAIGDVMGRGVRAAAVMGQVRAALRAYGVEGHRPDRILRRLNATVEAIEDEAIVTCLVAEVDPATGHVELASAGHPPLILADAEGTSTLVAVAPGPPLGVPHGKYATARADLPVGGTLVLFTDGLVESRDQPVTDGMDAACRLLGRLVRHRPASTAAGLCEAVVVGLGRGAANDDDVAVLVARRRDAAPASRL